MGNLQKAEGCRKRDFSRFLKNYFIDLNETHTVSCWTDNDIIPYVKMELSLRIIAHAQNKKINFLPNWLIKLILCR